MLTILSVLALGTLVAVAALDTNKIDVKTAYNEYCEICEDHTLCKFEGLGESCEGSEDGGVTEAEKKYILETHNNYRRRIAKGLETRGINGSQPGASNMMKLEWDDELAKIAQHWADQCTFQHDTCRHDRRFKVGQNIYWNWRFPILKSVNWTAAMASWYDEVDKFDPLIASSYEFDPATGHYTQLVWHDSTLMGCGRRSYGANKIYVCNYGPTGNWLTEPLYHFGHPCSRCPSGTQCQDGLCEMQSENQDTYSTVEASNENITVALQVPAIDAINFFNIKQMLAASETEATTSEPVGTSRPAVSLFQQINMLLNSQAGNHTDMPTKQHVQATSQTQVSGLSEVASHTAGPTTSQTVKQVETTTNQQMVALDSEPVPEISQGQISDLPIHLNLIDGLIIPDNDEIRNEIEDVKRRIRDLLDKIVKMNLRNNSQ